MQLLLLLLLPTVLLAWDPAEGDEPWKQEEIALFELVDALNGTTFYELMNITINATAKEIKQEYKKQAKEIHPDKNPETEEEFKKLAAVYNVLKDQRTRDMYHRVLEEGLPVWRMPAFYDRQVQVVRHIGLLEGMITLFILATFIQYGMGWAHFLEQKFLAPKPKVKKEKKTKKTTDKEEAKEEDEFAVLKPSVYDTLPFQIWELCKQTPDLPGHLTGLWSDYRARKAEEAAAAAEVEEEKRVWRERQEAKKAKRKVVTPGSESS